MCNKEVHLLVIRTQVSKNTLFYDDSNKPTSEQLFSNISVHDPKSCITSRNNACYMRTYNNFSQVWLIISTVHDQAKVSCSSLEYPTFQACCFLYCQLITFCVCSAEIRLASYKTSLQIHSSVSREEILCPF